MIVIPCSLMRGVHPLKPIICPFPGRIRIRMRNDNWTYAFVRHEGSTRRFLLSNEGANFVIRPEYEQGRNVTYKS